jgi:hypothetical protein
VSVDQRLSLGEHVGVTAAAELGLEGALLREQPHLLEPRRFVR